MARHDDFDEARWAEEFVDGQEDAEEFNDDRSGKKLDPNPGEVGGRRQGLRRLPEQARRKGFQAEEQDRRPRGTLRRDSAAGGREVPHHAGRDQVQAGRGAEGHADRHQQGPSVCAHRGRAVHRLGAGAGEGWEVCKVAVHLYGLRTAASSWEREYSQTLEAEGFVPGIASKCTFFHPARTIRIVVHGDDFVIEGVQEDLDWTKGVLANKYLVKVRSILGAKHQDDKVADILNRVVEWHDDELWWEADPRHVEKMLEDIGLEDCKPGAVPGTQRAEEQDGELELDRGTAWKYRSIVAGVTSLLRTGRTYDTRSRSCAAR